MSESVPVIFVVDDDAHVRCAFERVLRSAGYRAETFSSAQEFLMRVPTVREPACILLDLRLPDASGLDMQRCLVAVGPVIFVSAYGDMRIATEAMKAGAFDFLEKPVDAQLLLDVVGRALEYGVRAFEHRRRCEAIRQRMKRVTPREHEVMLLVAAGLVNKVIADRLGIAEKTVKIHRGRVMEKMAVRTLPDLVRCLVLLEADTTHRNGQRAD